MILSIPRKAVPKTQQDAFEHICGKRRWWSSNWTTGSRLRSIGCQPVLQGNTPGDPQTIPLRLPCPVHCTCFHKHNLVHNRRRQNPTPTKSFVCAYRFLVCVRHIPVYACPSCAHTRHLFVCVLTMSARALCLHVFTMFVFLASCRRGYSTAE